MQHIIMLLPCAARNLISSLPNNRYVRLLTLKSLVIFMCLLYHWNYQKYKGITMYSNRIILILTSCFFICSSWAMEENMNEYGPSKESHDNTKEHETTIPQQDDFTPGPSTDPTKRSPMPYSKKRYMDPY